MKVAHLKFQKEMMSIEYFQGNDLGFVIQLIMKSKPYQVPAGKIIYNEGDISEEISFLMRGSVRIKVKGKKGMTSGYVTSGGFFGDFEYSRIGPRIADYVSAQCCTLLSVPYSVLREAIKDCPVAGEKFLSDLKQRHDLFSSQEERYFNSRRSVQVPQQLLLDNSSKDTFE